MNKPIDYPIHSNTDDTDSDTQSTDITFAELKVRMESEQPVTDEMIRMACTKLDVAHTESTTDKNVTAQTKSTFDNLRDRFR